MKLAKSLTAITLLALSGLAAAEPAGVVTPRERHEIRRDNREIAGDRHELRRDKRDLRQERREGDVQGVREERHEVRQDKRDLRSDRIERHRDVKDALK